jgi:endoglucanase
MFLKRSILFLLFLTIMVHSYSQTLLQTQGKIIVNQSGDTVLLRGMGLGGWMLQEGYMLQTAGFANAQYEIRDRIEQLIGTADTDLFYDAWLANHARKADIDSLAAWGFNSVRLPMHYNLFTLPIEDEPVIGQQTWLTKGFELTDSLIEWCKQNQMYVILDLHAAPGGQGGDAAISDYDPTKPSLWESAANRTKTVELWKKLAERYANEPAIAGYDLLNETNWQLPGNVMLRALYEEITDSIRTVDNDHIIFIEGNWWANDFTGLTPPWDNNMVYSPHKYWSINDQASIQWVLDMRNTYDVPLYLGESGENSNTWFRDAIRLLEDNNIGWAWWPMKKIESTAGPLSVIKSTGYQNLLDYWSGTGTAPSAAVAKATLMQLTEDLKIENCKYQKDVTDAMFRQVYSNETKPYKVQNIPGIVYAVQYDMGVAGAAYSDKDIANYQVSTGNFTAWNNGWQFRNDGVDIEKCNDNINNLGYNIGWTENDEWLKYTVDVATDAVYDINMRIASGIGSSKIHFKMNGSTITNVINIPNTGGWGDWQTLTIPDVILSAADNELELYIDSKGVNISSFQFIQKGSTTTLATAFLSANTSDESTVQLNLNKTLTTPVNATVNDFTITVNGVATTIDSLTQDANNARIIYFDIAETLIFSDVIKISYTGNTANATDGTPLAAFTLEEVKNMQPIIHNIPGRIQAEDYFEESGTQLEFTSDLDGLYSVGFLDTDDYMDYYINVATETTYSVGFRTASENNGQVTLQLIDNQGNDTTIKVINLPSTGSWNNWVTTLGTVTLPAGEHHLRLLITQAPFNINWMEFDYVTSIHQLTDLVHLSVFPNPTSGIFRIEGTIEKPQSAQIEVFNSLGQLIISKNTGKIALLQESIDLSNYPTGTYIVSIRLKDGTQRVQKLIKIKE